MSSRLARGLGEVLREVTKVLRGVTVEDVRTEDVRTEDVTPRGFTLLCGAPPRHGLLLLLLQSAVTAQLSAPTAASTLYTHHVTSEISHSPRSQSQCREQFGIHFFIFVHLA